MERQALAGVRVVDFSWAAAGPLCTLYLAFLGAEVIKIESSRSLDIARRGYYTHVEDIDASPNFNDMNLNKLDVRLNLTHPRAGELIKRLVGVSDVVVQNFRPGVMERFGLAYPVLRRIKPDIVMLSSSTAGLTGPEKELPGYATTFGALGGLGSITGHEDGPPTEIWDSVDMRLGTANALAVLMALYHQRRTGEGQHIDLSSREVISTLVGDIFFDYFMNGRVAGPRGNRDDAMAPHNCYPCKGADRWISIAVATDEEWRALCEVAGHTEWSQDPRFVDGRSRWLNQGELDRLLAEWTRGYTAQDLMERLQRVGVAAMPSMDVTDILDDPHIQARRVFQEVDHPRLHMAFPVGPPWKLSETPAKAKRHGPMFGEHVEYVFGEIVGIPRRDLEALQAEGVFE